MNWQRKPLVKTSWALIIAFVLGIAYIQTIPTPSESGTEEDPAGLVIARIQAEYLLGVSSLMNAENRIAHQAEILNTGTVDQRQRYMAFMIALGDTQAATLSALHMKAQLEEAEIELTPEQFVTQEQLDILASGGELPENHEPLELQLGWFGLLLQATPEERETINASAERKILIVGSIFSLVCLLCLAGLVGLIVCFVRVLSGKLSTSMRPSQTSHGVYSEVFALWLFSFVALTAAGGLLAITIAKDDMFVEFLCVIGALFASMFVLFWARVRGISWEDIRCDIGWTSGAGVIKEMTFGIAGYAMMLPILVAGILMTLLLVVLQQIGSGEPDPFAGTGGGSHPIIVEIAEGGWRVQVLLLAFAVIVAPIVEETMFRGVLYRHLRSAKKNLSTIASIVCSVLLTSFLFASIHPQGWIAIPALMGIAIGMNLMREWRGTLIPSMVVHGVSNGIVTSFMLVFLG